MYKISFIGICMLASMLLLPAFAQQPAKRAAPQNVPAWTRNLDFPAWDPWRRESPHLPGRPVPIYSGPRRPRGRSFERILPARCASSRIRGGLWSEDVSPMRTHFTGRRFPPVSGATYQGVVPSRVELHGPSSEVWWTPSVHFVTYEPRRLARNKVSSGSNCMNIVDEQTQRM